MSDDDHERYLDAQVLIWREFAKRIELRFPFPIDLEVAIDRESRNQPRVMLAVVLHVLERDTREPITVRTRRPCDPWNGTADAVELVRDLLKTGLHHEIDESVRLDGHLERDVHGPQDPG